THDQVEAMTLADKIVVLRAGEIAQVGTPLQLYDDPDNLFVAGFMGSPKMNLMRGVAGATSGGQTAITLPDHGGQTIVVPAPKAVLAAGAPVTVGLRPSHFDDEGSAALDLTVDLVEHLGSETFVYARAGQGALLTVAL